MSNQPVYPPYDYLYPKDNQSPYGQSTAPPPPSYYTATGGVGPNLSGGMYPPNSYAQPHPPPPPPSQPSFQQQSEPFVGSNVSSFSDTAIRHAFIRKVYLILTVQLAITIAFISLFLFVEPVKIWMSQNSWLHWTLMIASFVLIIVLVCCGNIRRQYPLNIILLMIFTVVESILLGVISAHYKIDTVLIAIGITGLVVLGITIFSFQTKYDFTGMGTYLFVAVLVLFGFSFICLIIRSRIANIVYAALGAGLFSMYLVFDTQLMLGGKHYASISPEEYIMATLNLYLDIINLFLMILRLVGYSRD